MFLGKMKNLCPETGPLMMLKRWSILSTQSLITRVCIVYLLFYRHHVSTGTNNSIAS